MPIQHSGSFQIAFTDGPGFILGPFVYLTYSFFPHGGGNDQESYFYQAAGSGSMSVLMAAGHTSVVTTADGTFDVADAPPGFTPTTALGASISGDFLGDIGDSFVFEDVGVASSTTPGMGVGFAPYRSLFVAIPSNRSWALLSTDIFRLTATLATTFLGWAAAVFTYPDLTPGHINNKGLVVAGNYDIIFYWWLLPDVTPCGQRNTNSPDDSKSHLVLAGEKPETPEGASGDYQLFDPEDPVNGAPTPVIYNIEPNHGRAGTRITIVGDGFGDGCNVQFDGSDALDIFVDSKYQVKATAPAHANGWTTVAVINPDGVST